MTTNLRGGGAERAVTRVGSLMAGRGHDVRLILLEHLIEHSVDPRLTVHALTSPGRRLPKGALGGWMAAWRLKRLAARLADARPFDWIVSTLPYADEAARRAALPRLWCRIANTLSAEIDRIRASDPRKAARRRRRYRRLYEGQNLIAVSDGVMRDLRDGLSLARANVKRIYNPFDFEVIRQLADAPAPHLPAEPYVIHVGRFAAQKRHDLLFAAWRRLRPAFKLVLLVDDCPELRRLIAESGLSGDVIVAGFKSNPYPWIQRARLLVLCSDHEGLPNVLVEALACGTPVVSTDCPSGPQEILTGALRRFLAPPGDAEALAEAIGNALEAPVPLHDVDLSRFDARQVVEEYERLGTFDRPN